MNNNNAINGDGIERVLDRFRVDLTSLEASLRNQEISSSLYKDIDTVGKIIMLRKTPPSPSRPRCANLTLSPIPVIQNLRRDVYGNILLTQMEMLTYIWLPHFASAEMTYDSVLALLTYISLLKEATSIPVMPPLYVLLITVLISLGNCVLLPSIVTFIPLIPFHRSHLSEEYSELSIFFSPHREEEDEGEDSEEQPQPQQLDSCLPFALPIAATALRMSDQIFNNINATSDQGMSLTIRSQNILILRIIFLNAVKCSSVPPSVSVSMLAKIEAGKELKEFGLRELIRSGRPEAAVEWLLDRGLVIEAIEICRESAIKIGHVYVVHLYVNNILHIKMFDSYYVPRN